MEIRDFFEQSEGKWFVQRTTYELDQQQSESSKSEIVFELIDKDNAHIIKLCEQHQVDTNSIWGGAKISWDNSVDWGKPKQTGFSVLLPVPNADNPKQGKLLRLANNLPDTDVAISYVLGDDDVLTFIAEGKDFNGEERLWFADPTNPNLRLRTNLEKHANGYSTASFYSEIRRISQESTKKDQ